MAFQNNVALYQAPGREGDFASCNDAFAVVPSLGGCFRAGSTGTVMARFAWRDDSKPSLVNNSGTGEILGFVRNERTALVNWDEKNSMTIPQGQQVSVYKTGDFWAKSATVTTIGQKVYAKLADGTIETANAGTTKDGFIETPFKVMTAAAVGEIFIMSSWS
ncbi:structural cement protein Gp24 [Candidatus Arsenophonus triatominarum]|uniref:structural cement protein Gp24 n=1 Tax=Candidatus Arsenophonus triatominarum TaxID=57911 RepID=UPI0007C58274|nr:hypothetical protein [Candidatus Arsenophonus triatominarum]